LGLGNGGPYDTCSLNHWESLGLFVGVVVKSCAVDGAMSRCRRRFYSERREKRKRGGNKEKRLLFFLNKRELNWSV